MAAMNYPDENDTMMSCSAVPLLNRVFGGQQVFLTESGPDLSNLFGKQHDNTVLRKQLLIIWSCLLRCDCPIRWCLPAFDEARRASDVSRLPHPHWWLWQRRACLMRDDLVWGMVVSETPGQLRVLSQLLVRTELCNYCVLCHAYASAC